MKIVIFTLIVIFFNFCGETNTMTPDLKKSMEQYIAGRDGEIAVSLHFTDKDIHIGINDTVVMHAASTMKVTVMIEVFRQAGQGLYSLSDSLPVKNEFKSIIDHSIYKMDIDEDSGDRLYGLLGKKESIRNLVIEMIVRSGNLATNLLIDLVSADKTQRTIDRLGASGMQVVRGVEDIKAYRAGKSNTTTAAALTKIFLGILNYQVADSNSTDEMIEILLRQEFNDKIPAGLPDDVRVAHKTGSITAINHDAGIVFPPDEDPYVLTVLTRGFKHADDARRAIAHISSMVYKGRN